MKPSEILFRAAKLQCRRGYRYGACYSLCLAAPTLAVREYQTANHYLKLFSPRRNPNGFWFGDPVTCTKQERTQRQLALLFAAEIARSDETK